jgi:hypothetical protein
MTDNEMLVTGELCDALLHSMHFNTIVAQYERTIAADILATKQDDKNRREELYQSLWGSRGLLAYMQLNADTAAAIKNPPIPEDDVTTDFDPRDDESDFNS